MLTFISTALTAVWAFYIAGQCLHMLKRADLSASSKAEFFRKNAIALACRFFVATLLFCWWRADSGILSAIAQRFGVTVGITLPVTPFTAGLYGFVSDAILDWLAEKIPFLKKELPEIQNGQH